MKFTKKQLEEIDQLRSALFWATEQLNLATYQPGTSAPDAAEHLGEVEGWIHAADDNIKNVLRLLKPKRVKK